MKCPGQDMQYWRDDAIYEVDCPKCGASVEFYKDDTSRRCHGCDHRFINPKMDFGCAAYCQFAEQCLGTLPEDALSKREDLIKDKTAVEVKRFLQKDFKKIRKTTQLAGITEKICKKEGGNLGVLICCAYLLEIPAQNRTEIMTKINAPEALQNDIIALLASLGEEPAASKEQKILSDANDLVALKEMAAKASSPLEKKEACAGYTKRLFFESSAALAQEIV